MTDCVPAQAAGVVRVGGDIATDTVWSVFDGTYEVSGVVTVDPGATLYIEPGTVVKFAADANLNIAGALNAAGSPNEPVYFTSLADDAVGGDSNGDGGATLPTASDRWGINFLTAGYSTISGAVIRYSGGGIFNLNTRLAIASSSISFMNNPVSVSHGKLTLTAVSFSHMYTGALWVYASSSAMIASTTVDDSRTDAVRVYGASTLSASKFLVRGVHNGSALIVYTSTTASCDRCVFADADGVAGTVAVYSGSNISLTHSKLEEATGTIATALELYDPAWDTALPGHSQATISNTVFDGGQNGITAFGPVILRLATTTIQNFSNDGIQLYDGATIAGEALQITKNSNAGIEMWSTVNGSVQNSDIVHNGQFGILSRTTAPFTAVENWWGSADGPYHATLNATGTGDAVSDNVTFSPWLHDSAEVDPHPVPCCSSVLFIPGIEASRLYATSSTLLGHLRKSANAKETKLWEPGFMTPLANLALDSSGASTRPIYTKDIIKTTNELLPVFNVDIYQKFSGVLDTLVSGGVIASWQAYPYDWRLDPKKLVEEGTARANAISRLQSMVTALAATSKTKKVTIVAHSNGGILAELLLNELQAEGKSNLLDKVVLVAVPQHGTPLAIPALLSGYGQEVGMGFILNASTAQKLAENMPAAYTLLPTAAYFKTAPMPAVVLDPSLNDISNLYSMYGAAISDAPTLSRFLRTAAYSAPHQQLLAIANKTLLTASSNEHAALDTWRAPSGINVIEIAGVGVSTLAATRYYARKPSFLGVLLGNSERMDMAPQMTKLGDNTVVTASAAAYIPTAFTYYVDLARYNSTHAENRGHADILETLPAEELLIDIVQGTVGTTASRNSALPPFVSTTIPRAYLASIAASSSEEKISVHSPVMLHVYDDQGRHTGPSTHSSVNLSIRDTSIIPIESKIPNSYYVPFGEGQYAAVPAGTAGKIVLQATAAGTATLDITLNGTTTEFADIPVAPGSIASVDLGTTTTPLNLDYDGDGVVDATFSSGEFDPRTYPAAIKKLMAAFERHPFGEDMLEKIKDTIQTIENRFKILPHQKLTYFRDGV